MAGFPPEWDEDETMQFLFGELPENKADNEDEWNAKIKFWTSLIHTVVRTSGQVTFTVDDLCNKLRRKGVTPQLVLTGVLRHMYSTGSLVDVDTYKAPKAGMLGRTISALVGLIIRPSNANIDSKVQRAQLLLPGVLRDTAQALYRAATQDLNPRISAEFILTLQRLITLARTKQLVEETCKPEDLQLVLSQLVVDKKAAELPNPKHVAYKLAVPGSSVQAPTAVDIVVADLKSVQASLDSQIASLSHKAQQEKERIRECLAQGQKPRALQRLKVKKSIDRVLDQRYAASSNVDLVLGSIEDVDVNQMVVEGLKGGNDALKSLMTQYNLKGESVADIMAELDETLADAREVDEAIAAPVGQDTVDNDVLEAELSGMLAELELEEKKQVGTPAKKERQAVLPSPPSHQLSTPATPTPAASSTQTPVVQNKTQTLLPA